MYDSRVLAIVRLGSLVMGKSLMTLDDAVQKIVDAHGGVRAASRATGVDKSFISRLMTGKKTAPSDETLKKLGLKSVPLYEVIYVDE